VKPGSNSSGFQPGQTIDYTQIVMNCEELNRQDAKIAKEEAAESELSLWTRFAWFSRRVGLALPRQ
jgi:hypothetical protein